MEPTNKPSDIAQYGDKYHFYYNFSTKTVVCVTFYKGQVIRGAARCNPEDNFDIGTGRQLAYLRCKQKFAKQKLKRAQKVYSESILAHAKAENNLCQAREFMDDSEVLLENTNNELIKLEMELNNI